MTAHCCATLADCLALAALRAKFRPLGYRIFRATLRDGTPGTWCATWGSSAAWEGVGDGARVRPGATEPGALFADNPRKLAKLIGEKNPR